MQQTRKLFAEAMGTFIFFTIGIGAVISDKYYLSGIGLTGVALAHGVALALVVSAFGRISGAHVNPAVTAGLWMGKKIETVLAAQYIAAQLIGALAAAYLLRVIFSEAAVDVTKLGTPMLSGDVSIFQGVALEALLTFFLVMMVYATAVDPKAPSIAGFGIGLMVFLDVLVGGPITGAAMNPARAFGPAVASMTFDKHYVYWVGPMIGGLLAGWVYPKWFASDAK